MLVRALAAAQPPLCPADEAALVVQQLSGAVSVCAVGDDKVAAALAPTLAELGLTASPALGAAVTAAAARAEIVKELARILALKTTVAARLKTALQVFDLVCV